eukprot:scaffold669468_cov61-Prasinocladus_malaysianus.AAC.1
MGRMKIHQGAQCTQRLACDARTESRIYCFCAGLCGQPNQAAGNHRHSDGKQGEAAAVPKRLPQRQGRRAIQGGEG